MKTGLVLEGGGMRGLFTIGVLDSFLESSIKFDYVIGVSAGACNAVSYISEQKGRNYRVNTQYISDKRYISISNYIKSRSLFGMDFIFEEIPDHLEPFDYDTFLNSPTVFVTGVTDVITGKPVYFSKEHLNHDTTVLRASSSIPIFSPIVEYKEGKYLDGGTSDPIPVKKALEDGCDKCIVVLTREREYQKKPEQLKKVYEKVFRQYPNMVSLLDNRHHIYNDTLDYIKQAEKEGKVLVLAPKEPLGLSRFENHIEKLQTAYDLGLQAAKEHKNAIKSFLEN